MKKISSAILTVLLLACSNASFANAASANFQKTNRAEFATLLVSAFGEKNPDAEKYKNCYKDVRKAWYAKYICYAFTRGWTDKYKNGKFSPANKITRAVAVKMIAKALSWKFQDENQQSKFVDNFDTSKWYWKYLLMAEERGIFDELDQNISPNEYLSRQQAEVLIDRAKKQKQGEKFTVLSLSKKNMTYQEVLATGIKPYFSPETNFPAHSQKGWPFGCYSFSVKNLMEFKYGEILDIAAVQKEIGWDGTFIWSFEEFEKFAKQYNTDIVLTYNATAEFFFKKLAAGEPMILYIPYYLRGENIGHQLVAYSFDEKGVWVADSLSGGIRRRIGFDQVFVNGENYTQNLTQLRKTSGDGEKKFQ